ncbi:calmodulin-binding transcription activator 4 isoform X3 [Manihot esculenta]|uniref:Uncharacterized protein n=1 Tax=Manihot esculenta TaxID=3983 RepID=A0ACB7GJY1_MANES|nr:calmodulin-binding transcription activator 4 isoform X3 [Manihot esculenta]KAG8639968.1 hypothetical protein MANES_13G010200v8 [Manihot esculenta]
MSQSGYDINVLFQEAQTRWLKPAEVLYILQNHEKYKFTHEPPHKPTKMVIIGVKRRMEEVLGKHTSDLREYEHIVLVHYREVGEGKSTPRSAVQLSPGLSSAFSPSTTSHTTHNRDSTSAVSDLYDPDRSSSSPSSTEISSEIVTKDNGLETLTGFTSSPKDGVSQFLRRLEEHLSLNEDSIKETDPLCSEEGITNDPELLEFAKQISEKDHYVNMLHGPENIVNNQCYDFGEPPGLQLQSNNVVHLQDTGDGGKYHQPFVEYADGSKESISWNEVLESCKVSSGVDYQEKPQPSLREPAEEHEYSHWLNFNGNNVRNSSELLPQDVENFDIPLYSPVLGTHETNPDYYSMLYDEGHLGVPIEPDSSLTVSRQQKFTIREISPEWGFTSEATKVIIVGSFLCDPSESAWKCMFGETEVPTEIIQEGVLCCVAPPHLPGKVTFCVTSGNRESCSEVREFEYRAKSSCPHCNLTQMEVAKGPEELLLLVRFVQMLLSGSSMQKEDSIETGIQLLRKLKTDDGLWSRIIETLLIGNGTSTGTIDWLLEQLLKDKLQQWLSFKSQERRDQPSCTLSKKEQGIIHMVAGLGFEWALSPIISQGIGVNFRDINGWTALHWAARFGREKMIAALLAFGASAGVVTDPTSQDPVGKTPASIAADSGHKGLAGYLSEVALTSHLSSLTLGESELSKGSAEVEAEKTVDSISKGSFSAYEDQVSLKDTLAAVRNAAQAAARIQAAFRAHSFRKRQKEAAMLANSIDEYGLNSSDIHEVSAMSKLAFGNAHDYKSATLYIQKKYRGWKVRQDFLAFRRKVVKIQAHVRGYQVRKRYKVICWAVGILEKAVLRWRRKGVGLRGFRNEGEAIEDSEDEDILKLFRKQKVDAAIEEAVSRVLSMVDCLEARQQYRRMLERYREAKAEVIETSEAAATSADMENDDILPFQVGAASNYLT